MVTQWTRTGTIGTYTVWHYPDAAGRFVYRITTGPAPTDEGGYASLSGMLRFMGLRAADLVTTPSAPRLGSVR